MRLRFSLLLFFINYTFARSNAGLSQIFSEKCSDSSACYDSTDCTRLKRAWKRFRPKVRGHRFKFRYQKRNLLIKSSNKKSFKIREQVIDDCCATCCKFLSRFRKRQQPQDFQQEQQQTDNYETYKVNGKICKKVSVPNSETCQPTNDPDYPFEYEDCYPDYLCDNTCCGNGYCDGGTCICPEGFNPSDNCNSQLFLK